VRALGVRSGARASSSSEQVSRRVDPRQDRPLLGRSRKPSSRCGEERSTLNSQLSTADPTRPFWLRRSRAVSRSSLTGSTQLWSASGRRVNAIPESSHPPIEFDARLLDDPSLCAAKQGLRAPEFVQDHLAELGIPQAVPIETAGCRGTGKVKRPAGSQLEWDFARSCGFNDFGRPWSSPARSLGHARLHPPKPDPRSAGGSSWQRRTRPRRQRLHRRPVPAWAPPVPGRRRLPRLGAFRQGHTVANGGPRDGMPCQANVGVGPYSVLILSQGEA
jgi:hypothetical protein